MKATLFKNLTNKPSEIEIQAGKSIKESLPNINFKNALIYANNRQQTPEYVAQESDLVIIRMIPAEDYDPWDWVFTIATGGLYSIGKMAYDSYQARKKAEEKIEKMKKLSNRPDIDNRPFLRGASNTVATGNSQPYIIGRHFFTPYLLSKPFYQIVGTDGADEYTYTALECGFNKQILQSVAIDDIKIKTFSDNTPQEGAYNIDAGIFAEDGKLEIAQDGAILTEIPELNYKVESTSCNDNIPRDSEVSAGTEVNLTYTLNKYAKDVDIAITFPNGLFAYNKNNDKVNTSVTITPQYSLDGGANWNSFTFNNNGTATNTFNRNVSTKEMRFVAHKDFSKADYDTLASNNQEAIMIRLTNNGSKDSKITNACYCIFYQSVCFDPDKSTSELVPCKIVEDRERAFCTVLGLKLKATKINEDKLKKINIITHGIARTWDGTEWSTAKTATRNPAAWALEILTSDSHPASKFRDSEIDLDSFGDYYEYCENPENDAAANHFSYHFDWVITQNTKKQDTLNHILNATNARIYQDITGKLAVAIDRPQENAVAVYNPQNIIDIKNKKTTSRVSDGMRIKYTDSKNDLFQESTYLVMREGRTLNENSIIKDLSVTGITEHEHIVRYARRLMAIETLRPKTTTLDIGNEGLFYIPYSKVLVQDDSLKIGIGKGFTIHDCTWQSGLLKKIYTNEPLTFDPAKTYGIIVNCFTADDVKPVAIKVEGTGTTHELTVISAIRASADAIPESGNVFSFGELDENGEFTKVTTEYIISNITRGDNGFKLELVNYNEAIYDSGTIPEYKSNMTQKKTAENKQIPADTVTHTELEDTAKEAIDAANEAAAVVTQGVHFTQVHKIRFAEESDGIGGTKTLAELAENITPARGIIDTIETLRNAIDEALREANAGISVTDDKITLKVADSEEKTYALIELTKDRILEVVEDTENSLHSEIEQTAESITQTVSAVQDDVTDLQGDVSQLEQTAQSITSTVQSLQGDMSTAQGDISDLETAMTTAQGSISQLEQTAESITAQVETNDHKQSAAMRMTQNDLIAMIDDALRDANAGISLRADEIILQVENTESKLRSTIDMTAGEILAQVDDMAQELTGLIDVQASAITAMVQGGGATGQMSLSLELPVIIDAATRAQFVQASTEAKVAAVYAQLEGTSGAGIRYAIKGHASNAAVKALWDDAVAGALIASQIDLSATQINMAAENVVITGSTNHGETIIQGGYLKTALIEVDELLSQNITLKQNGYIRSSNYAESSGYPTAGFMLDCANNIIKAYQMKAVGGTFKEGFFEGLLDCGVFKVKKDTVQVNIVYYSTSQKSDFENYYYDKWGLEFDYTGSVAGLYGTNAYIRVGNTRYENIQINIFNNRDTTIYFYAYNDINNKIEIYSASGSVAVISEMYYPFWIEYYQQNVVIAEFANLPTFDPHSSGMVWNQNGNLRISEG